MWSSTYIENQQIKSGIAPYTRAAQPRTRSRVKHYDSYDTDITVHLSAMCVSYYRQYACNHAHQTGQTHQCIHKITGRSYKCSPRFQKEPQPSSIEALSCPTCRDVRSIKDVPDDIVRDAETVPIISSAVSGIKYQEMACAAGGGLQT